MIEYENYLEKRLELQKVKYVKHDDIAFYFHGINRGRVYKIKVLESGRVFINDKDSIIKVDNPFAILLD